MIQFLSQSRRVFTRSRVYRVRPAVINRGGPFVWLLSPSRTGAGMFWASWQAKPMLERAGLGNEFPALILDDHGHVIARILGEAREVDVRRPLDWLLGRRNGPAPEAVVKHY